MIVKATIERLGHQGDGIAPGPVYAPRTLPGETIEGEVSGTRMPAPKIITPSADRVAPLCRHYKSCGGCALQHAADDFVHGWKRDVVYHALKSQGIIAEITGPITSPPRTRRRATFSARRTKKGALVGFHARASDMITEIPDCHLLHPELLACIPALRKLTIYGAARKSELRFTATHSGNGVDVVVAGGKPLDEELRISLAGIASEFGLARLSWDDEPVVELNPPYQQFGPAQVVPPPGAFLQATAEGEKTLVKAVLETVINRKHVVDLFAGCGTFSLPLAKNSEVHAVEGQAEMLKALDTGWRQASGLKRVTTETRDLFRRPLLADEISHYDAVVIDPPRAGAEQQFHQLAEAKPEIIMSVSCSPASFARDAKILLEAGYRIGSITVVDQFRWSVHVEIAAGFTLN